MKLRFPVSHNRPGRMKLRVSGQHRNDAAKAPAKPLPNRERVAPPKRRR